MDVDETTAGRDDGSHDNAAGQEAEVGGVETDGERPMDIDVAAASDGRMEEPLPGLDPVQGHAEGGADHVSPEGDDDDDDGKDSGQVNIT